MQEKNDILQKVYIVMGCSLVILVLSGSLFLLNKNKNTVREYGYIGKTPDVIQTMNFAGEGKVDAKPDIAIISMGLTVEKVKISDAQKESATKMNAFIEKIKNLGVESKDIKTQNYNIYPQYDWINSKQVFKNYQVTQSVEIKIRNLDKISEILGLAGEFNLNQVGNLTFDVDKKEEFQKQAKIEAIKKAKENAQETADMLGVKLGRVISFNEYSASPINVYNGYAMKSMDSAVGGAAPMVEAGNAEIKVNVSISYELQ